LRHGAGYDQPQTQKEGYEPEEEGEVATRVHRDGAKVWNPIRVSPPDGSGRAQAGEQHPAGGRDEYQSTQNAQEHARRITVSVITQGCGDGAGLAVVPERLGTLAG
jgi:hypothetical protein